MWLSSSASQQQKASPKIWAKPDTVLQSLGTWGEDVVLMHVRD